VTTSLEEDSFDPRLLYKKMGPAISVGEKVVAVSSGGGRRIAWKAADRGVSPGQKKGIKAPSRWKRGGRGLSAARRRRGFENAQAGTARLRD